MTDVASLKIAIDAKDAKDAEKALSGLEKQSGNTERSAASMMRAFAATSIALAGTALIIRNSVKAATEYENALKGLASIARYAGEDINQTLGRANELVADGMLSVGEAATAMKNLLAKGFNTDQAVEMINRLKDAAAFGKQGSLEFGQAVLSATEGIKNENSILVDNAGVTKNLSVMVTEYASSVGKSVVQLSEAEKRQAIYNGLMRETEGQLGNAALAASGMEGATARMNKAFNDSAITIGQSFMPAATALTDMLTSGLRGATENVLKPFLFLFENIGVNAGELVMSLGATFEFIGSPSKWFSANAREELAAQFQMYEDLAEESRKNIAARLSGISTSVNIGADTGKRRSDVVRPEKPGKEKSVKDQFKEFDQHIKEFQRQQEKMQAEMTASALSAQQIFADVDPIYKAGLAWEKYMELVKGGYLDLETAGKHYAQSFGETTDQMTEFAKRAGENIQDAFAEFLFDPFKGGVQGMLDGFTTMLRKMAAEALASQILGSIGAWGKTGGGAGTAIGGIVGAVFGGGKATGGAVSGGTTYLVGERGPELFTPSGSGNITPNEKLGGKSVTVINNFVISQPTDRRTQEQIAAMAGASIQNAMLRGA